MRSTERTTAHGAVVMLFACLLCGCRARAPLAVAPQVDVPRFMGQWYVIASIPTRFERDAYAATETYTLAPDGTIATVFTFHRHSLDGPGKTYMPKGFVRAEGNGALWDMQFLWPFRADYRVMYVDPAYTQTVVGRERRDYAWIMARTPQIAPADYENLRKLLSEQGYDTAKLRQVPQVQRGR